MMKSSLSDNNKDRNQIVDQARQAALRKLSSGERTEKEVLDFLCGKGCTAEEAAQITHEFSEWGYIDDKKYCRRYFEYGRSKGKATARIIRELAQKGISSDKAREVLSDMKNNDHESSLTDDRDTALTVGMKMAANQADMGKLIDDKFLARVGRRLAGLGYDSSTCYYVIGRVRAAADKDE